MAVALLAALFCAMTSAAILSYYRRDLQRFWSEPVFRCPVLVLESDDWGAGPTRQAHALNRLTEILGQHRDAVGRQPIFNLAIVLAVPDCVGWAATGKYSRLRLDHPQFASIVAALEVGRARGVFAYQLHGLEHFWPLAIAQSQDPVVRSWCQGSDIPLTELLPSHLQSRWVDATTLPSRAHSDSDIAIAVAEEVSAYKILFPGSAPVVVPPTFVWSTQVESAWSANGITTIVTPGVRYTCRLPDGGAGGIEGPIVNGQRAGQVIYVVRTDYFEPRKGRGAQHALRALDRDVALGRPCVLENHRDNFCSDDALREHSEAELDGLLRRALANYPTLRFLTTWELSQILRVHDSQWLVRDWRSCLPVFWLRVRNSGRLWKLLRLSGLSIIGLLIVKAFGRPASATSTAIAA